MGKLVWYYFKLLWVLQNCCQKALKLLPAPGGSLLELHFVLNRINNHSLIRLELYQLVILKAVGSLLKRCQVLLVPLKILFSFKFNGLNKFR